MPDYTAIHKQHFLTKIDKNIGKQKWQVYTVDLIFGSNSELRALSEVYASEDGSAKSIQDFVAAWVKVTENDLN